MDERAWRLECSVEGHTLPDEAGGPETRKVHRDAEGSLDESLDALVEVAEEAATTLWAEGHGLQMEATLDALVERGSANPLQPQRRFYVRFEELDLVGTIEALEALTEAAERVCGEAD